MLLQERSSFLAMEGNSRAQAVGCGSWFHEGSHICTGSGVECEAISPGPSCPHASACLLACAVRMTLAQSGFCLFPHPLLTSTLLSKIKWGFSPKRGQSSSVTAPGPALLSFTTQPFSWKFLKHFLTLTAWPSLTLNLHLATLSQYTCLLHMCLLSKHLNSLTANLLLHNHVLKKDVDSVHYLITPFTFCAPPSPGKSQKKLQLVLMTK